MSPTLPQRPLRVQSDARLLQLARRGEAQAFEALVRRYRRQLLGYCRRFGMGEAQAEDVLQQGLLHAWRALCRGDEVRDVKSWMYRVVHNAALDALRRPGRDNVQLDESLHVHAASASAGELDRRIAISETLTGLAALPDMQREALLRTAVHGDSHEQVASALGLSHAAVRGLVHRARLAMRTAAGALVPERAIEWLMRLALGGGMGGSELGGPELAASSGSGAGMLAALAKGGAVLAAGGVLVTGLVAVHRAHARHVRPFTPPVGHVSARAQAGGGRTLLASADASRSAAPDLGGRSDASRMPSRTLPRSGSWPGRARIMAPALARRGGSPPVDLVPVSSIPSGAGVARGPHSSSSAPDTPGFAPHGADGRRSRQSRGSHAQGDDVSGDGGDGAGRAGAADRFSSGSAQASTTSGHKGGGGNDDNSGGRGSDGAGSSARVADSSRGSGDSIAGEGSHTHAEGSRAQDEGGPGREDGMAGESAQGENTQGGTARDGGTAQNDQSARGESAASGSSVGAGGSQGGSQGGSDEGASHPQSS
jgi:RNA polymerase sigma-70 factor, ECF subfamily